MYFAVRVIHGKRYANFSVGEDIAGCVELVTIQQVLMARLISDIMGLYLQFLSSF